MEQIKNQEQVEKQKLNQMTIQTLEIQEGLEQEVRILENQIITEI